MGKRWFRQAGMRMAGLALMALALLMPAAAVAQSDAVPDWRGKLTCTAEHQLHEAVLYCTGTDGQGHTVHVVVVDLSASSLRFEYVLPEGSSDCLTRTQCPLIPADVKAGDCPPSAECRDPNVPEWGGLPGEGCFDPDNKSQYPRMLLSDAETRAREVQTSPGLVALINGDYTDTDNSSHGPEGLLVVRGVRLDGVAHCDDDYNAALRPWLGLGEAVDPATGLLRATIARLPADASPVPDWVYTGIGGGPWLVEDDDLNKGATICQSSYTLSDIDPVENCYCNGKTTPAAPLAETYRGGSCRAAPHTAAGISADGRWLFLAVSTGENRPQVLANFLHDDLGAESVIKFDGGGSSQLWFSGNSEVKVDPSGQERKLNSFLAVYSAPGKGIVLPLAAEPVDRVLFQVLDPGERVDLTITVRNSGDYTWSPDDDIVLRHKPFFLLSPLVESLPLSGPVPPGGTATWHLDLGLTGVLYRRYQVYYKGEKLGADLAVIAVELPEAMVEKRQELEQDVQELIDEWKAKGDAELDQLVDEIRQLVEGALGDLLAKAEKWIADLRRDACGCVGLAMVLPIVALAWRRR